MTYDTDPQRVAITHSASIRVGSTIKMRDIRMLAESEGVPDDATVTVSYSGGDQRDYTPGSYTISMTWAT